MNLDKLCNILEEINLPINSKNCHLRPEDLLRQIQGVTTYLQKAHSGEIVFYYIDQNKPNSYEEFLKRLNKVKNQPLLIFINSDCNLNFDEFLKWSIFKIPHQRFYEVQKLVCDEVYPFNEEIKLAGITGTNGKTTTAFLSMEIASQLGYPSLFIGTIGLYDHHGKLDYEIDATTPSYVELRKIFFSFYPKYKYFFLEVSSHALHQNRLYDMKLSVAGWTNFTQDHLDYHLTMHEYFNAKSLIGSVALKYGATLLIPNDENENFFLKIQAKLPNVKMRKTLGINIAKVLGKDIPPFFKCNYNRQNFSLALHSVFELFQPMQASYLYQKSVLDIEKIKIPPGRFFVIKLDEKRYVVIDYAHTPDAIINIAQGVRSTFHRVTFTIVFGCGGNRDRTKRPLMGKASCDYFDKVVITSDNPRFEEPLEIIDDILAGIDDKKKLSINADRKEAILNTLAEMKENEVVVIAGKGHENYQDILGHKLVYSDFDVVEEFRSKYVVK